MDIALAWLKAEFQESPVYWAGIATWVLGFGIYLYSGFVRVRPKLNALASASCWAGFVASASSRFVESAAPGDTRFVLQDVDLTDWEHPSNLIWLLWIVGGIAIVSSWVRLTSNRAGWLGLCVAMVAVVASWAGQESYQLAILIAGTSVVLLLFLVSLQRGQLRRSASSPGDYETELIRLCQGNRRAAQRLIREELKRSPGLSRAGAALAAVTRIRHETDPPPPL